MLPIPMGSGRSRTADDMTVGGRRSLRPFGSLTGWATGLSKQEIEASLTDERSSAFVLIERPGSRLNHPLLAYRLNGVVTWYEVTHKSPVLGKATKLDVNDLDDVSMARVLSVSGSARIQPLASGTAKAPGFLDHSVNKTFGAPAGSLVGAENDEAGPGSTGGDNETSARSGPPRAMRSSVGTSAAPVAASGPAIAASVAGDLGWIDGSGSIKAERLEDLMATAPETLSGIADWVRGRIAAGLSPVPLLEPNVVDEAMSLVPFGLEIEFDLVENDPAIPMSFAPKAERLVQIGQALYAAGLTTTSIQEPHHANRGNPTIAKDGWKFEKESSADGEIISPILTFAPEAEAVRAISLVVAIVIYYGGVATPRTGYHINRGVGVIGEILRRPEPALRHRAFRAMRGRLNWSAPGRSRSRIPAGYDARHLVLSSRIIDYFLEELFRVSTNPAADEHRGAGWANAYWTPAARYSGAEAVVEGRRRRNVLSTHAVKYRLSDYDEYRLADASLNVPVMIALLKLLIGLALAPLRDDDPPAMGPSPPTAPLGRFFDPLATRPPRVNGWRVFDIETRVEAERLAELLATAFSRREDMVQFAPLFVLNPWLHGSHRYLDVPEPWEEGLEARVDAGPRPRPELALLLADVSRYVDLSYPREITLRLSDMEQVLDRLSSRDTLPARDAYASALLPSGHGDAVLTEQAVRELYEALDSKVAAIPDVERPRWLMDRLAESREQWQSFRDDAATSVSDWRRRSRTRSSIAPARRRIPGGHWLLGSSAPEGDVPPDALLGHRLEGMVTVAGRLRTRRGATTLAGMSAAEVARWLADTYPAGWPGFRAVLLPVPGSGTGPGYRAAFGGLTFGAQLRAALRALGRSEGVLAASAKRGRWTWYQSGRQRSTVFMSSLEEVGKQLGHRVISPSEENAPVDSAPVPWPAGRQLPEERLQRLREFRLENLFDLGRNRGSDDTAAARPVRPAPDLRAARAAPREAVGGAGRGLGAVAGGDGAGAGPVMASSLAGGAGAIGRPSGSADSDSARGGSGGSGGLGPVLARRLFSVDEVVAVLRQAQAGVDREASDFCARVQERVFQLRYPNGVMQEGVADDFMVGGSGSQRPFDVLTGWVAGLTRQQVEASLPDDQSMAFVSIERPGSLPDHEFFAYRIDDASGGVVDWYEVTAGEG